jgi:hypothetical protein
MLKETYKHFAIEALPKLTDRNRFAVAVKIARQGDESGKFQVYEANDHLSYTLQIEAEKECINFGKHLIDMKMLGWQSLYK